MVLLVGIISPPNNAVKCDLSWVPSKPEIATYRLSSSDASQIYQLAIARDQSTVYTYINIVSPGFMKFISGSMALDMTPMQSASTILINDQVRMDTQIRYDKSSVNVTTLMEPMNQTIHADVPYSGQIIDSAQIPFLLRTLPLHIGAQFEFTSLNPRNNTLEVFRSTVAGEEIVHNIDSYLVRCHDFEGDTNYWLEKALPHRILRMEQLAQHRMLEIVM